MEKTSGSNQKLIFTNGAIYLDANRRAQSILVENGIVSAIDVDPNEFKDAEMIDLKGGTAYPGFIDSHVHLVATAAADCSKIYLNGASTAEDIARITAEACSELPKGQPALGRGYMLKDYDAWNLGDLATIDEAIGDRAILLADQTGHSYIANSVAMKESGLQRDTLDPPGGKIVRKDGEPTGMLRENAGCLVGNKAIFPKIPDEKIKDGLLKLFDQWASMGYTSVLELMGGPMGRMFNPKLCKELEAEGRLPLRVNYAYTFFNSDEIDELETKKNNDMDEFKEIKNDTDMVSFAGLKLFVDGAAGNGGSWTTFENKLHGNGLYGVYGDEFFKGKSADEKLLYEKYHIKTIVEKADGLGLDIHYHVQGDKAVEVVLKAIEDLLEKNGQLKSTHTFFHLGFVSDEQIDRMKKLNKYIIGGVQPSMHWGFMKQTLIDFYGEQGRVAYPFKKLKDAGIPLAFSSDFPSNEFEFCSPIANMKAALTGGGDPIHHPPLTMNDLIHGYTIGGRATTRMKDIGELTEGKKADFVVYEKDLYSVPPEELSENNPKLVSTWVGGCKVHPKNA